MDFLFSLTGNPKWKGNFANQRRTSPLVLFFAPLVHERGG